MPIKKAALKAMRSDARKHARNTRIASELRTLTNRFEQLLSSRQVDQAKAEFALLLKRIDQARIKGVLHRNTAARKKSRLSARLARTTA